MKDKEYIRAAIEMADGWIPCDGFFMIPPNYDEIRYEDITQMHKDALAAQLVRQEDENGTNHAMNTIKAIVDSKDKDNED